jgi:hypothetical protein
MDEHLILYIDLLGFKAAIRGRDEAKTASLIKLLHDLKNLRGEFNFDEEMLDDSTQLNIRPAISTFSDLIVISYRTEQLRLMGFCHSLGNILLTAKSLIANLAIDAMKLGLLIRGGATVGSLHHKDDVVLGEALIEAYELESQKAIYPRIILSSKLYSEVEKFRPLKLLLLKDDDGMAHLNYFDSMIRNIDRKQRMSWLTDMQLIVTNNIENFERPECQRTLGKWVWFRNRLEQARLDASDAFV